MTFSLFGRALIAGFLAYFLALATQLFLIEKIEIEVTKSPFFLFLPALTEELIKIFFAWRVSSQKKMLLFTVVIIGPIFGLAEAWSLENRDWFDFFRLPFLHLAFSFLGLLTAKLIFKNNYLKQNFKFLMLWILASSFFHWLFNLVIFSLNQSF